MPFFIHIEDPGFPDAPWPGIRRLGPFDTDEEAFAQAVSDIAVGMGASYMGVYDDDGSSRLTEGHTADVKPVYGVGQLAKAGKAEAKRRADAAKAARATDRAALNDLLPGKVTVEDLEALGLTIVPRG